MKTCTKCNQTKPTTGFYRDRSKPDGLRPDCRSCCKSRNNTKYSENREEYLERCRKYRSVNGTKVELKRHGLTLEQYEEMLFAQGGRCKICSREPRLNRSGFLRRFSIDHDHKCCPGKYSCGKCVRGLLCYSCNSGLGQFEDNPEWLREALRYLAGK